MLRYSLCLAGAAIASPASAHIVFAQPEAAAGSYYAGFLRVGHGCGDSATTAIRVEMPEALPSVRPQPKPGWTLEIERKRLDTPVAAEGGGTITERVSAVVWKGRLPADQFDQFGLLMKLPAAAGPLYFPTTQSCETGSNGWTAIPPSPDLWHSLPRPAPMLNVTDAEGHGH